MGTVGSIYDIPIIAIGDIDMSLLTETSVTARTRAYNHNTEEAYLKALNGDRSWKTKVPTNDNMPEPVQLDLFPETLVTR